MEAWVLDFSGAGVCTSSFLDFFFEGDRSLWTVPPPHIMWLSSPPLAATVLVAPKGAESPDSVV